MKTTKKALGSVLGTDRHHVCDSLVTMAVSFLPRGQGWALSLTTSVCHEKNNQLNYFMIIKMKEKFSIKKKTNRASLFLSMQFLQIFFFIVGALFCVVDT